ncbi:MAG TPA: hypothetical protein VFA00_14765, partial [Actinomycetota bacterium]|nr:hypothetical protein [Actinomycetota bacterium]
LKIVLEAQAQILLLGIIAFREYSPMGGSEQPRASLWGAIRRKMSNQIGSCVNAMIRKSENS